MPYTVQQKGSSSCINIGFIVGGFAHGNKGDFVTHAQPCLHDWLIDYIVLFLNLWKESICKSIEVNTLQYVYSTNL